MVRQIERAVNCAFRPLPYAPGPAQASVILVATRGFPSPNSFDIVNCLMSPANLEPARRIYAKAAFRMTHSDPCRNFGKDLAGALRELALEEPA
jgi:hypothetical protein